MTSFGQVVSIYAAFLNVFIPTVLSSVTTEKVDVSSKDTPMLGAEVLGFRNFNDFVTGLEEVLGAKFEDDSPLRNIEDLLSGLNTDEYDELVNFIIGDGLGLPEDEFTKSDSGIETVDGVKVRTNASVHWLPNDARDGQDGGTLLGLIKSDIEGDGDERPCSKDSDCEEGQFCTPFVLGQRHCSNVKCVTEGKPCYNNDQCCGETALCAWGQCSEDIKAGESGTTCKTNADCLELHCCAVVDGHSVCKPYSTEGAVCSDYQKSYLNTLLGLDVKPAISCPCEEGLFCRSVQSAVSVLDIITGEKICVPSSANAEEEAVENMAEGVLQGVFDEVADETEDVTTTSSNIVVKR
ncbi:dickkopf-related protein 3-like [Amphiura filiformis]|uniref:dickkopf-related protein 3-like n=1 Tax=Amphiura filiformis TaxID=82378 RepID=UPI003B222957